MAEIFEFPANESRSITLKAPAGTYRNFKVECARQGRTMGDVMRELMADWLRRQATTAVAVAALLVVSASGAQAGEGHRPVERLPDGRIAVRFFVPVCADASSLDGQAGMPVEKDGELIADVVEAPAFANGAENCSGVAFSKIHARSYYTVPDSK